MRTSKNSYLNKVDLKFYQGLLHTWRTIKKWPLNSAIWSVTSYSDFETCLKSFVMVIKLWLRKTIVWWMYNSGEFLRLLGDEKHQVKQMFIKFSYLPLLCNYVASFKFLHSISRSLFCLLTRYFKNLKLMTILYGIHLNVYINMTCQIHSRQNNLLFYHSLHSPQFIMQKLNVSWQELSRSFHFRSSFPVCKK